MKFRFDADVWEWDTRPNWYFVAVPEAISAELEEIPRPPQSFRSFRVSAQIGASRWQTSIFGGRDSYALPLKRTVRLQESIEPGDTVTVEITLMDL